MVYLLFADGFEEVEAITPLDVLRRCGVELKTVGVTGEYVTSSHGLTVKADIVIKDASSDGVEMIILPGGSPGFTNIEKSDAALALIRGCADSGAYIAAICGAPTVLGKMGLLKGKKAVCFPGLESELIGAGIVNQAVVTDGKTITSMAAGTSKEFAFALARILSGAEKADEVCEKMCWR